METFPFQNENLISTFEKAISRPPPPPLPRSVINVKHIMRSLPAKDKTLRVLFIILITQDRLL